MAEKTPKKKIDEDAQQSLAELDGIMALVEQIKQGKIEGDDNFNLFFAVGMGTQEIRHSAFLKFLFDPKKPHGLNNLFLNKFLKYLYAYDVQLSDGSAPPKFNKAILRECYFSKNSIPEAESDELAALDGLSSDKNCEVHCEVVLNKKGELEEILPEAAEEKAKSKRGGDRIDIFIKLPASKTIIVIENKIGSDLHSDQLIKYEKGLELSEEYKGENYKKIFVYLRMDGSAPLNEDESYNKKWCLFDYEKIKDIIGGIYSEIKGKRDKISNKLKIILEDYMAVINIKKLHGAGGADVRQKIRDILKSADNVEMIKQLNDYYDNDKEVFEHIFKWLETEFKPDGYRAVSRKTIDKNAKSVDFVTTKLEKFFADRGEPVGAKYRVASNPYIGGFLIMDQKSSGWTPAQEYLINNPPIPRAPFKKSSAQWRIELDVKLLEEEKRGLFNLNSVVVDLDNKLEHFRDDFVRVIDSKL